MAEFTVEDLLRILRAGAGTDERSEPEGRDLADVAFDELGYDSLALLELASRVERAYGFRIPDGEFEQKETPRQVVDYVNSRLAEVVR
ncbi:acyl carrier protein [Kitasatospora sp. NPDC051853]|uniref:acyl carrier protein n=1 Tax=Kitasatospora sp. NPDC051853 TaxID=3364058 RepID=UPI0037889DCA